MPTEQPKQNLPSKAPTQNTSPSTRMADTQDSDAQSADKPKTPSTFQDWASF